MKKMLFLLVFLSCSLYATACVCGYQTLAANYYQHEFVAEVKILSKTVDPEDKNSTIIDVEILNLFKGKRYTTFSYESNGSSCSFNVDVNSTWLIFSNRFNGKLGFHYCGGATKFYDHKLLAQISEFKDYKSIKKDVYNIKTKTGSLSVNTKFKHEPKNDFALVEFTLSNDLQIKKLKFMKSFSSRNIDIYFQERLIKEIKFQTATEINQTKFLKVYYLIEYHGNIEHNPTPILTTIKKI